MHGCGIIRIMKEKLKDSKGRFRGKLAGLGAKIAGKMARLREQFGEVYGKRRFRDKELLKAYVGKNYEKFARRKFNIAGFFLTSLYMFYRKMRWSALLVFGLQIGLIVMTKSLVIHEMGPNLAVDIFHQLVISLLVGFLVNKFYLWDAEHKIAILRQRFPKATHAELMGICMARGRTSIAVAVPWVVLEILISVVAAIAMLISDILSGVTTSVENFEHEVEETVEAGTRIFEPKEENSGEHEGVRGKITELVEKFRRE